MSWREWWPSRRSSPVLELPFYSTILLRCDDRFARRIAASTWLAKAADCAGGMGDAPCSRALALGTPGPLAGFERMIGSRLGGGGKCCNLRR